MSRGHKSGHHEEMSETLALLAMGSGGGADATAYAFVYRPGGVADKNVYTTWPALYVALSAVQGDKLVQVDDSIVSPAVVPAGTYDLDGVTFDGISSFATDSGGAALTFDSGAVINAGTLNFTGKLQISYGGATPLITVGAGKQGNYYFHEGCFVACTGAGAFIEAGAGAEALVSVNEGGQFGDGTHAVFTSVGASSFCGVGMFDSSTLAANATAQSLGGDVAVGYVDAATVTLPQGAGVTVTMLSEAENTEYTASVVANWSGTNPTSVANALDRIAAWIAAHGGPIP
jgi:hypothetical protein